MEFITRDERNEMLFTLGRLSGYLARPAMVDALNESLDQPDGDAARRRLLELHQTLTVILADDSASPNARH